MVQTRVLTTSRHLYVYGQESNAPDSLGLSTARAAARNGLHGQTAVRQNLLVTAWTNPGIAVAIR